jgi:SAM-dependent methyltransferase
MHLDVVDLRAFYYRTKLGRIAQQAMREQVVELWPDTKGQTVAGFGFAAPMLRPFLPHARRVLCLMPGQQGVMPWPEAEPNHSVLVEETKWPVATGKIDRLVVLHGLETCDRPGELLQEVWRVLGPGGRVLFIVPNRSGMWARRDVTPFGYGQPYSMRQLEQQLRKHRFLPERNISALYTPPSQRPFWMRTAKFWEGFGRSTRLPLAAGVVMVEATKQVYAPSQPGLSEAVRRPLHVLEGMARPAGKPVPGLRRETDQEDQSREPT